MGQGGHGAGQERCTGYRSDQHSASAEALGEVV